MLFQAPPPILTPAPAIPVRAQYGWGYAGPEGEGVGTLSLLMEPISGRLVLELHAPGGTRCDSLFYDSRSIQSSRGFPGGIPTDDWNDGG